MKLAKSLTAAAILLSMTVLRNDLQAQDDPIAALKSWLKKDVAARSEIAKQPFAAEGLSKKQADEATQLLLDDYARRIKSERAKEWEDKAIQLGDLKMKFDYKVFGEKPKSGRSLFISMHGGGGAPARVNEQQWKNQIRLYEPQEGVYLAPRAPTDTWNLWHQGHIDKFFGRIIENAIYLADVDPNRVYIMGYSAGGDGVYQLAPRMADQLAAAAMMAGHPNNASALGLRNIGFTLHMGGKDGAYNRNKKAAEWKKILADLRNADPDGYPHEVVIHEEFGHWMKRKDAVAVPWMAKFTRDPLPKKIVWHQTGTIHDRFYWLAVDEKNRTSGSLIVATRNGQGIRFEKADGVSEIIVRLNDKMMDLDAGVTITQPTGISGKVTVQRTIKTIADSLQDRGDIDSVFTAEIKIPVANSEKVTPQDPPNSPQQKPDGDGSDSTNETVVKKQIAASAAQLVKLQEKDGAWPYEGVYRVRREIPVGYRIGGTAIVCESLMSAQFDDAMKKAVEKGVDLILQELEDPLMKPSTENRYDVRVWGHIYALDLFCRLKDDSRFTSLTKKTNPWIQKLVDFLVTEEIKGGGWNYANQRSHAAFVTAPAVQALLLAKQSGAKVPAEIFDRSTKILLQTRAENGAYQYSGTQQGSRREALLPGSIARSAICETTLILLGKGDQKNLQASIDAFHKHWEELEKRRKKTGTHKPPFGVAPYYFYYGHRYVAQAIQMLPPANQTAEYDKFVKVLMKTRDDDHTWNDRVFDRSKAYGTAMSVMALANSRAPLPPKLSEVKKD